MIPSDVVAWSDEDFLGRAIHCRACAQKNGPEFPGQIDGLAIRESCEFFGAVFKGDLWDREGHPPVCDGCGTIIEGVTLVSREEYLRHL